ncbi:MAG: LacI family DNA-binding transcriptional regulator [Planctomycetes bacterium]|nr:LacI family DNA-binding transcriptional regulator [Planctomycetota bacterium]
MPVSIEDVAKLAKVSISTVSRVINRRELVNEQTRARVESAIQELGYRPNAFARGLMLRRSEIVALVLPDLHGEFYLEIIRGANLKARALGYNLVVSSFNGSDDGGSLLYALEQRALLDGLAVMISDAGAHIGPALAASRLPFVVLDDEIEGPAHDSVIINQACGAATLMRHLLTNCGVRRVIFVGGPATNTDTQARLTSCREVLKAAGLALPSSSVYHLDYLYETAYVLASKHLPEWRGRDACIVAANDEMAAGIVAAANSLGVEIPNDIAVVGFDDTRIARMTRPPLTTVRVPTSAMGASAIEILCQRIAEPQRPPTRISLDPELVVRESCGGNRSEKR